MVYWLTGHSGAGKTTVAESMRDVLRDTNTVIVDGDTLRGGLCSDLQFSPIDRAENVRRAAHVARLLSDQGCNVIVTLISPTHASRAIAREIVGANRFRLVYLSTPIHVCEARDPKGLYARYRRGEIKGLTGLDAPYEEPTYADIVADTNVESAREIAYRTVCCG